MSGHRQAAVALYSLARGDQTRILAELSAADRRILEAHLVELAELGFDRTANMGEAVTLSPVAPNTTSRLHCAVAAEVHAVVAHEPVMLIAQLLKQNHWPWAPELLEMLTPQRRAEVHTALSAGVEPAPARASFVVAAVSSALSPLAATPAPLATGGRRRFPWTR